MDKVFIKDLTVLATIGAYEWEKQIKQKLLIDLEMAWDNRPAAMSDDLSLALDYASVSQAVSDLVTQQPHELVETVAEKVAALILNKFSVPWVKVTINKPGAVPFASNVGVQIERSQADSPQ
ncbi:MULTISPECIES: dihydroneopterin aldolase [unclassified Agarivorans]|uniref:dihydroneopterin aldolase n=1 Tax=unclassified Agarivorans TaxID=2636026 RepID=UPI0026E1C7BB|nr:MULTISPECIES: dihydroneopterin aldolase [unclassified Agarivorans]MDO6685255.1 dihydroneopterin aldolase [Agarivorans sp. 3_MG-2023]MDO6715573.1 dihydroneopterin aldolase [Agarivorans sp. 2_MG-2023]